MTLENPSVGFILEAFGKRSIEADNLFDLKHEHKNAVNCRSEQRDVFAGFAVNIKHFSKQ